MSIVVGHPAGANSLVLQQLVQMVGFLRSIYVHCKHVRSPAMWVLEIEPGYSGRATTEPSLDPLGPFFKLDPREAWRVGTNV